jgi:hypothetical protein
VYTAVSEAILEAFALLGAVVSSEHPTSDVKKQEENRV